ncbi:MAG: YbjN domain-containing protein [Oscillospiraceae bacterium]|nr:YbjN domain-containing protein [Oscillospiraceae bacterium]
MEMEQKRLRAGETFRTICRMLDQDKWSYQKDEEKLIIQCGAQGESMPIDLVFRVDAERMAAKLVSYMSYTVPEDKRLDIALAITTINNQLVSGSFDFDIADGTLYFRMTNSFMGCVLGTEAIKAMLYTVCATIDQHNDKLFLLSNDVITLEQFLEKLNKEG